MRKTILTILVAGFAGICLSAQEQPYKKMAEELSAQANKAPMNVSVGNFLYEDTKLMSGFSAILRNELGSALTKDRAVNKITFNGLHISDICSIAHH